jgi:hypothetical protein
MGNYAINLDLGQPIPGIPAGFAGSALISRAANIFL